ncbi:MAG: signal recognition particle protein, partial [Gammaproteobacteria bacterium]|nr:signal recognition particle protein [Gammaproteobacteria bacterium]
RPAAIEQLETLAGEVGVAFFPCRTDQDPVTVAAAAVDYARKQFIDVVLVDTAGRLHVDADMMDEARRLHAALDPVETLFVVDSMTGQDAANTAKAFHDALALTGVILTKTDGDARGGAALSLRRITGKPIKFLGVGEKTAALEVFHPERIASRILGMGDILSLIEEAERKVDRQEAEKLARKLKQGKGFDLEDFRGQLQQMRNMGGVAGLLDKLPGMAGVPQASRDQIDDRQFVRMEAIINSMTPQERRFPAILKASRKRRIATGAGVQVQDINRLLKQFEQMQRVMKQMSKGGMNKLLRGFKGKLPF